MNIPDKFSVTTLSERAELVRSPFYTHLSTALKKELDSKETVNVQEIVQPTLYWLLLILLNTYQNDLNGEVPTRESIDRAFHMDPSADKSLILQIFNALDLSVQV